MTAAVTYGIEIEYISKGNLLGPATQKLNDLAKAAHGIEKPLAKVGEQFAESFTRGVDNAFAALTTLAAGAALSAGAVLGAGLAKGISEGARLSDYKEQLGIGIASVQSMLGGRDFHEAEAAAAGSVERLRTLAQALPGSFQDAARAFQYILPVGTTHGVDTRRLEDLAARSVAAAASVGVSQAVAGHELAALLEGRATSRMPLGSKIGIHAKEFNQLPFEKRLAKIEELFGRLDPAIDRYSRSWAGLTSSLADTARQLASTATAPLFERAKDTMGAALDYLGAHGNVLESYAERFGHGLVVAYDAGLSALRHWGPLLVSFGREFAERLESAVLTILPYVQALGGYLDRALSDPKGTVDKLVHAAEALAALRVGSAVVSGGLGLARAAGPALGALEGIGGAASVAALGTAAGVAVPLVAALGFGALGATELLADSGNALHDMAQQSLDNTMTTSAQAITELGAFWETLKPIREVAGAAFLKWLEASVFAVSKFYEGMMAFWSKVINLLGLKDLLGTDSDPAKRLSTSYGLEATHGAAYVIGGEIAKGLPTMKPPVHNTTVHGGINIRVEGNDDPTRVAAKTLDLIKRELRHPSAATSNPNAMFSR